MKNIIAKLTKAGKIDKVYDSIATAATHEGVDSSNLRKVVIGDRSLCGGSAYVSIGTKQAIAITKKFGNNFGVISGKRVSSL